MAAIVAPRNTSREPKRCGLCVGFWLMDHLLALATATEGEDVLGALQERANERHVQALRRDPGVLQGAEPVEQLAGGRRLLVAALPQLVEDPERRVEQPLLDIGEVKPHDLPHLVR